MPKMRVFFSQLVSHSVLMSLKRPCCIMIYLLSTRDIYLFSHVSHNCPNVTVVFARAKKIIFSDFQMKKGTEQFIAILDFIYRIGNKC